MTKKPLEMNRSFWDEAVAVNLGSKFYDVDGFRKGACSLKQPELDLVGDVTGKRLLHLQCHFGMDSLSWARRGAKVTGVDFSPVAIEAAEHLSEETEVAARFVCADVTDLDAEFSESFDIVFSSWGVVGWIPDLDRWARNIARLLAPGGSFCLAEFHPQAYVFGDRSEGQNLAIAYPYFGNGSFDCEQEQGCYADPAAVFEHPERCWWTHTMAELLTAFADRDLQIERFEELPHCPYGVFPFTVDDGQGMWRLAADREGLPLSFVLRLGRRGTSG